MNSTIAWETYPGWLLGHSFQAAVLVLFVLLAQWIFRRQLSSRWRFALWWLVIARLLLPFSPESALSLYNVFRPTAVPLTVAASPVPIVSVPSAIALPAALSERAAPQYVRDETSALPDVSATVKAAPAASFNQSDSHAGFAARLMAWGFGVWLAGVVILALCVVVQLLRFRRQLSRSAVAAHPALLALLEQCRREFAVSRRIDIIETDAVSSPALFGLFRLRLLLPRGLAGQFTRDELRYIFLHELAHVKRGDLWLNWLATGLQIVHWFNPLVWLGFARMRADRELACDELVLLQAGDHAEMSYGETIIKLLEGLNRPTAIPGLVGILEDKQQMRRRIAMIANFRRPGRWSLLALILIAALAAVTLTDAQTEKASAPVTASLTDVSTPARPDLIGSVTAKGGQLVSATVFIATAGPKVGTSPFCPSCYADCQKSTKTDTAGNYVIKSLDPQLKFQVLAVAKGFKPKYVSGVDPAKGPVKITLSPIELADAPPANCLHGRVTDAKGKPVVGAVIEAHGLRTKNGGHWGQLPGVDPLAVADDNGEFLITSQQPFEQMDVRVSARGFANQTITELASGSEAHAITLTEGASVRGQILWQGRPLTNVSIGIVSVNRSMEHFTGNFDVGTDSAGRFLFVNLPPDVDYYVYGSMDTFAKYGAVPKQQLHAGKDGELTDLGSLTVVPAHRVAGQVVLADGAPIPPKTRLLLDRDSAWDSCQVILSPDGHFEFTGVPAELVSLSARVPGYRVSAKNAGLDTYNPYQLVGLAGMVDLTNLVFLLEPGQPLPADRGNFQSWEDSRNRPLRGAEAGVDHAGQLTMTGHVTDSQTGEPLARFQVTPGSVDNWGNYSWSHLYAVTGTNGDYTVFTSKKWSQPVLLIEAPGYLPVSVMLHPYVRRGADVALQRGTGPTGSVLNPDGTPAAHVNVLLLCALSQNVSLTDAGHFNAYQAGAAVTNTDASGHFTFLPQIEMESVVAASAQGYHRTTLAELATNASITLQPFGRISGTLHWPAGPGTNEDLDLVFADDTTPTKRHIILQNHVITDAAGHFDFTQVPAGQILISYRLNMNGPSARTWRQMPLQTVTVSPGQTQVITINAPERPVNTLDEPAPKPVAIPGATITGTVLAANGKPAAGAQVALKIKGTYLALGRATLQSSAGWNDGTITRADAAGKFTLPMYAAAESVIAVNEDGFARVSLDDLKRSPQLTLQAWGRIEGVYRIGHHFGTNQLIELSDQTARMTSIRSGRAGGTNALVFTNTAPEPLEPLILDSSTFESTTDDRGRFVFDIVPPGEFQVNAMIPIDANSRESQLLAMVRVQPGQSLHVAAGGDERAVTGKLAFPATNPPASLANARLVLMNDEFFQVMKKFKAAKTQEERMALFQSPEYQNALTSRRNYSLQIQLAADGTFHAVMVAPGKYGVNLIIMPETSQGSSGLAQAMMPEMFESPVEIMVPPAQDETDESVVDLGTITVQRLVIPETRIPAGK